MMDLTGYRITISYANECPCFQEEDTFNCSGKAVVVPKQTRFCLGFVENLIPALANMASLDAVAMEFNCTGGGSGCTAQMTYRIERTQIGQKQSGLSIEGKHFGAIAKLLMTLPMFTSFNENSIIRLLSHFRFEHIHDLGFKSYRNGDVIIKKGQPGTHLYIIVAGSVEIVDDNDNIIAMLSKGEVFGEMSLISGNPVGATVRVIAPTTVFRLDSKDFNRILPKFPMLQFYFTCLLTQRLAKSKVERYQELASGMSGKLSEIPPEEVLQTLHFNGKSGVLSFQLSKGQATVFFKDGDIVYAEFDGRKGLDAVGKIIRQRSGKFNFAPKLPLEAADMKSLGSFMGILMNSLKEMDDKSPQSGN